MFHPSPITLTSGGATALPPLTLRRARELYADESGAATAEYAVATMATVGDLEQN